MHEHEGAICKTAVPGKIAKIATEEKNTHQAESGTDWVQDCGWLTMGQAQIDAEVGGGRFLGC